MTPFLAFATMSPVLRVLSRIDSILRRPGRRVARIALSEIKFVGQPEIDDAELALWFVTPNDWLGDLCPAQAMHAQLSLVQMAARLDRHVACGASATPVGASAHRRR